METTRASRRSSVIPSETAAGAGGLGLRTIQLNDVLSEARQTLESARREASSLLADSRARGLAELAALKEAELARTREEGRRSGFEQGLAEGRSRGYEQALEEARMDFAEKHAALVAACTRIIAEINQGREEWWRIARQDLIELAIAIADRIVHCVGERDREVVLANLEEVIRLVGARTDVTIAVHPQDAATARMFAGSLVDAREQWERIQVVEEPDLSPGGCRVRWGRGAVDAGLETQLSRIAMELRNQSGTAPAGPSEPGPA